LFAILTGWIWAKPGVEKLSQEHEKHIDRLVKDSDKAIERIIKDNERLILERNEISAQRDAMAEIYQEKFLPILSELIRIVPALQDMLSRGEDRGSERRPR
jgi:hypothetical protein